MRIKNTFLALTLLLTHFLCAQQFIPVLEHENVLCHVIEVKSGMTLFSIAQKTNYSSEDIAKRNSLSNNFSLTVGQKLYLPIKRGTIKHTVIAKETLFRIASQYFVKVDSLIISNPGADLGIKIGQVLTVKNAAFRILAWDEIPQNEVVTQPKDSVLILRSFEFSDSIINYTVKGGENIYTIAKRFMVPAEKLKELNKLKSGSLKAGTILKIPLNNSNDEVEIYREIPPKLSEPFKFTTKLALTPNKNINIAVFLPFGLDTIKYPLKGMSKISTEYYMGALLAIDSLKEWGLEGEVTFYDYSSASKSLTSILASKELLNVNLVISPLHKQQAEEVAKFCALHEIIDVVPVNLNSDLLKQNPYVYQIPSANSLVAEEMANFLKLNNSKEQIVLIRSKNKADIVMEEMFLAKYRNSSNALFPKIIESNLNDFILFSKSEKKTRYVSFSTSKDDVLKILSKLLDRENTELFGLKDWLEYKELNMIASNGYTFNYISSSCFNYHSKPVINLHKKYRFKYNADITKMACLGYDMLSVVPKLIFISNGRAEGVMTKINFSILTNSLPMKENNAFYMIRYQDFESTIYDNEGEGN
jgi:LysM repeat protein